VEDKNLSRLRKKFLKIEMELYEHLFANKQTHHFSESFMCSIATGNDK
jgi:hypothetical protein